MQKILTKNIVKTVIIMMLDVAMSNTSHKL